MITISPPPPLCMLKDCCKTRQVPPSSHRSIRDFEEFVRTEERGIGVKAILQAA